MNEQTKRGLEALEKIWKAVMEVEDILSIPVTKKTPGIREERLPKIIKRVRGIIKGYHEGNAMRKLNSLAALLNGLEGRMKEKE